MTTAKLQVEVFDDPQQVPLDVQQLFDASERSNVEFGLSWYRTLIANVYAGDAGVHFFVLRRDGLAMAALPVWLGRQGRLQHARSLGNYYTALYAPALAPGLEAAELVPLIAAIREAGSGSASLTFAPMDRDTEGHRALWSALRLAGLRPFGFYCFGNWYLRCAGLDWEAYLASRTSGLRSTLKRMSKKFAAAGGTLEIISEAERVGAAIAAYEAAYAVSWKRPEPHPGFVPGLIETSARQGWLRLGIGWLNGRPVAAQLWIVAHGRAEIYKVAYDESMKQYSLGSLLTAHLMRHVIETDRVTEVDYLIGDDPYKQLWMSARRERWGMVAYNPATLGGLFGLMREALGRLAKPWLTRARSFAASARKASS